MWADTCLVEKYLQTITEDEYYIHACIQLYVTMYASHLHICYPLEAENFMQ